MDFKLDLKLQNELDLSISRNEPVVVFTTLQTDSMFILTFDLKKSGYGRNDIKIEINEDGSRMTVSGENPNRMGFHKIFIIPQGVMLDKVKARFDQEQSRLTIRMPKSNKGIASIGIQEFEDPVPVPVPGTPKENVDDERKESKQAKDNEDAKKVATYYTTPMIAAGSTLFVSLIVALFTFIRSKNQSNRKPT